MFTFEVTRSKPFAPPELEGEYKLTIKGRQMKMEKLDDGIKVRATCNKTDDWNMVDGINVCLERVKAKQDAAKEIKVGDVVEVIDGGKGYSGYVDWVTAHVDSPKDAVRFMYSCDVPNGVVGTVRYMAPHNIARNTMLAYVEVRTATHENGFYLMDVKGLKKI